MELFGERYLVNVTDYAIRVYDLEEDAVAFDSAQLEEAQDLMVLPCFAFDPPTGRGVFQTTHREPDPYREFVLYLQLAKGPAA